MKLVKCIALAAVTGVFAGALAFMPAKAADLGGDCCADLEERVAELEATTVRKGNRVVSVTLYGVVNRMLLVWDDGIDSDAYIVDNDLYSSRFGLKGSGTMKSGWKAGYWVEIEVQDTDGLSVSQIDDEAGAGINLRQANVYIESEQFGRVTIGQASGATDDLFYQYPGGTLETPVPFNDYSFFVRGPGSALGDGTGHIIIGRFFEQGNIGDAFSRENVVRYDSPTIAGFMFSASWGDDDDADFALRYKKQWNSIQISAAVGYQANPTETDNLDIIQGSAAIKHTPSGIWATAAYSHTDYNDNPVAGTGFDVDDSQLYGFMLGISKNWTGHGDTTLHLSWGHDDDGGTGAVVGAGIYNMGGGTLVESEVDRYGFGVAQNFDSASMSIYGNFNYYEFDGLTVEDQQAVPESLDTEDFWTLAIGSYITF